jgi:hypothetical protein
MLVRYAIQFDGPTRCWHQSRRPAWWAWPTTVLDRDERPVEAHAYAYRIVFRREGSIVARTRARPAAARRPRIPAFRAGTPFRNPALLAAQGARRKPTRAADGNRRIVDILSVLTKILQPR